MITDLDLTTSALLGVDPGAPLHDLPLASLNNPETVYYFTLSVLAVMTVGLILDFIVRGQRTAAPAATGSRGRRQAPVTTITTNQAQDER